MTKLQKFEADKSARAMTLEECTFRFNDCVSSAWKLDSAGRYELSNEVPIKEALYLLDQGVFNRTIGLEFYNMTEGVYIPVSVRAAERCLPNFECFRPRDLNPRRAIEKAEKYAEKPTMWNGNKALKAAARAKESAGTALKDNQAAGHAGMAAMWSAEIASEVSMQSRMHAACRYFELNAEGNAGMATKAAEMSAGRAEAPERSASAMQAEVELQRRDLQELVNAVVEKQHASAIGKANRRHG